jgi:hypothetical protein
MKKLFALAIVLFASSAFAQTTLRLGGTGSGGVTYVTTAAQDALTPIARDIDNAVVCASHGLSTSPMCTQAQLNALPNCGSGVCGTVYTADATGALQYARDNLVSGYFANLATKVTEQQAKAAALQAAQNGGLIASNTECANAVGGTLGNGCTRLQIACRALSGGSSATCQ